MFRTLSHSLLISHPMPYFIAAFPSSLSFFYLCLCLSMSLYVSLCLSVSVSLCLRISLSLSFSQHISMHRSLSFQIPTSIPTDCPPLFFLFLDLPISLALLLLSSLSVFPQTLPPFLAIVLSSFLSLRVLRRSISSFPTFQFLSLPPSFPFTLVSLRQPTSNSLILHFSLCFSFPLLSLRQPPSNSLILPLSLSRPVSLLCSSLYPSLSLSLSLSLS